MYPLHLTPGLEASPKADFWPPGLDTSTVRMFRDNLRARRGFRTEADLSVLIPKRGTCRSRRNLPEVEHTLLPLA